MASVVVVATGAALAVSVPFFALKEIIEKRHRMNMKKHLAHRYKCRVNFGSVDDMYAEEYARRMSFKKQQMKQNEKAKEILYSSDDEDRSSVASSPPNYDDLLDPPSYLCTAANNH